MPLSGFCQKIYPIELVIDGDTVVAITVDQSREINKAFLNANYYKIVNDSLNQKVILLEGRIENDCVIIDNQSLQINNLETIIYNKQVVIDRQSQDLDFTDKKLIAEKSKNKMVKKITLGSLALNLILFLSIVIGR